LRRSVHTLRACAQSRKFAEELLKKVPRDSKPKVRGQRARSRTLGTNMSAVPCPAGRCVLVQPQGDGEAEEGPGARKPVVQAAAG
jgi:hypothetical protein